MGARELFQAGKLNEAIEEQLAAVRKSPADTGLRVFLFELLSASGDLDRATRQLQAVQLDDVQKQTVQQTYLLLLDAERKRRQVFAGQVEPKFLGPPPAHLRRRLEAIRHLAAGDAAAAAEALKAAEAETPLVRAQLNDNVVEGLRDCDDLLGTVLELMTHGEYYWLPLENVDAITMGEPKYPRDLLWAQARVQVRDGPSGEAYLPAVYPGTHEAADGELRLGRLTDWRGGDGSPVRGVGAKLFLAGDDAVPLLEWRHLAVFGPEVADAPAAAPPPEPPPEGAPPEGGPA